MKQVNKIYFPNLDALRFVAFFFIFLAHAIGTESLVLKESDTFQHITRFVVLLGKTGFSFAFVLSGYINTWVILEENHNSGGNFKPFGYYVRRALRIWPLYYLILLVGFVLYPLLKSWLGEPVGDGGNPWYFIFFIGNFYLIENNLPHSPIVSVLWSLSVEEQFYVFWPFLLLLFRFRILRLVPLLIITFMVTTALLYGKVNLFWHTLFLAADIAMGALFAHISFNQGRVFQFLKSFSKLKILGIYILFWVCLLFYPYIFEIDWLIGDTDAIVNLIIEKLVFTLLLSFFIFEQNFNENSVYKFGKIKWLTWLGVFSYGLFCLHEIGILVGQKVIEILGVVDNMSAVVFLKPAIAFVFITPLAYFSYHYFEMKFLRLKRYFYSSS